MITLHRISSSAEAAIYHDSALKEGSTSLSRADNYYANEQGTLIWQGKGAELLGIDGDSATKEQFVELLEGKITNPVTGEVQDLSDNSKGDDRRLGYDFTISAPKSVSIVGIVGGDERVIQAHLDANATAMAWLEEHGTQVRVKDENGQNVAKPTDNLLYATVLHETSRENDPQLHNHNVVIAVTFDQDGQKWRSLTNDELFQIRTQADTIYKAELANNLRKAGYTIEYRENGIDFDIAGVSGSHLAEFSQRTQQMREALLERGIDPDSASHHERQAAVLSTRSRKSDLDRDYLQEIWAERAVAAGLDIESVIDRAKSATPSMHAETELATIGVSRAIRHLSEREQAFKVADLESEAVFFSGGAGIQAVKAAIAERKEDQSLVNREGNGPKRVTTSQAIADELTLLDSVRKGIGNGVAVLTQVEDFTAHLERFEARKSEELGVPFKLSVEQVNAARNVLMHPDKFQGIQGDAGTGKTAALEFVEEVSKRRGWEIRGIATSTTGARELETATGIRSETVAAFLTARDERIRMLKEELREIEVGFAHSPGTTPLVKRVDKRDLDLQTEGFSPGRYVFDAKSGEVLKSSTGGWHPLNTLGIKLQDAGGSQIAEGQAISQGAERFGDRFRGNAIELAGRAQESIGRRLASFEVVSPDEAKAARNEHKKDSQAERERLRAYLTKTAQIQNLLTTGNAEGKRFIVVMDESSMTGTKDSARISEIARDMGARVVLQGDIKQHGSVAAGKAFQQTQEGGINLSRIEETRRFDHATDQQKNAILEIKNKRFAKALKELDTTISDSLYTAAADRFVENRRELLNDGISEPKVGVVTITNSDRKATNIAVREALREEGVITGRDFVKEHLDDPKLTQQQYQHVPSIVKNNVDRITALRDYRSLGIANEETLKVVGHDLNKNLLVLQRANGEELQLDPSKYSKFSFARLEERSYAVGDAVEARANIGRKNQPDRIANGSRGTIIAINEETTTIRWADGKESSFTNMQMRHVDHSYAHTSHKEQGVTNHREIFVVSKTGAHWLTREATYVAVSRAKHNTEIVTTPEALPKMLENAGQASTKSTAIDIGKNLALDTEQLRQTQRTQAPTRERQLDRSGPELEM